VTPNNSFKPTAEVGLGFSDKQPRGGGLIQVLAPRSSSLAKWKKAAARVALTIICVVGVGYITSWLSLDSCTDETFREIHSRGISGTDMLGNKVTLNRNDVSARIIGPFFVETAYLVPYDLHGSLHYTRYVVLPWWLHKRSSNVINLVMAQPTSSRPGANNSFNPTAGVGLVKSKQSGPAAG